MQISDSHSLSVTLFGIGTLLGALGLVAVFGWQQDRRHRRESERKRDEREQKRLEFEEKRLEGEESARYEARKQ
jgi:hypothetical protein